QVVLGEEVVVDRDHRGHDSVAVAGDAVAPSPRDLGDESVTAELDDEARHTFASSTGFAEVGWWSGEQLSSDVGVVEPSDGVLTVQGGAKECEVFPVEWIEAGVSAPAVVSRPAQRVERGVTFAFHGSRGQRFQVAPVGVHSYLAAASQVAHAFSHRAPPP